MLTFNVFQTLVRRWVVRAFGVEVADDKAERTHRFLEEALELAQATDCTQEQAHALVEYVYGRPVGKPGQEVGGTLLTLAALCSARGIDMNTEAVAEVTRVNKPETLEKIRQKQEAKKRDIPLSPLPGNPSTPDAWCQSCEAMRGTYRAGAGDSAEGLLCCGHCNRVCVETVTPLREPPAGGKQPRTHTDAVATTGGKATVARPI